MGNPQNVVKSVERYNKKAGTQIKNFGSNGADGKFNPEESQNPRGSKDQTDGNVIALATGANKTMAEKGGMSFEEAVAYNLVHGAGHNADMQHSGDHNGFDETGDYQQGLHVPVGPNIMTDGPGIQKGALYLHVLSPMNILPKTESTISIHQMFIKRFGNNKPNATLPTE